MICCSSPPRPLLPLPLVKVWVVTELEVPFFTAMAFTVVVSLRVKASL